VAACCTFIEPLLQFATQGLRLCNGILRLANRDVDAARVEILVPEGAQRLEVVDTISGHSERIAQGLQCNHVMPPAVGRPQAVHAQSNQSTGENCMVCLLQPGFRVVCLIPSVLKTTVNGFEESPDLSGSHRFSSQFISKQHFRQAHEFPPITAMRGPLWTRSTKESSVRNSTAYSSGA